MHFRPNVMCNIDNFHTLCKAITIRNKEDEVDMTDNVHGGFFMMSNKTRDTLCTTIICHTFYCLQHTRRLSTLDSTTMLIILNIA